jgi:sulfotransferase family protein
MCGRMIFNVGARRSGTFWLQRIVSAHPQVSTVPSETHLFSHGIAPLFDRFQHSLRSSATVGKVYSEREATLDAARDLCDVVFAGFLDPGATHVAERTPLHVLHLDLIAAIYPDAHFAHIVRDGRDVARSLVAQSWGPETIEAAAKEWRSAVTAAWEAKIPSQLYREVRYEQLLENPHEEVAELYRWLALPVNPEVVQDAVIEARIGANLGSRPSPIGTAKWRQTLSSEDLAAFDRVAGDLLAELSYPPSGTMPSPRSTRAPAVAQARELVASVKLALGRRRRGEPTPYRQQLVDEVAESLRAHDHGRLAGLMSEDALVRVVWNDGRRDARSERGRALLRDLLEGDSGLEGRQLRGDVFPGTPYAGLVMTNEGAGGVRTSQVAFMRFAGDRVGELVIYRL